MNKNIWGPIYWYIIHKIVHNFIENKTIKNSDILINKIKRFYIILPYILPCNKCSDHTIKYIEKDNPSECKNAVDLFQWTFKFHNYTNIFLKKKKYTHDILFQYDNFLNHEMLYNFLIVLEKLKIVSSNFFYINYYNETIRLLRYILPCNICSENIKLIQNNMNDKNLENLMFSHFPNEKSTNTYKYFGFKINIKNDSLLYRYIPVIPGKTYEIFILIKNEDFDVKFYVMYNNKSLIKSDFILLNKSLKKIKIVIPEINQNIKKNGLLCLKIFFNKCKTFSLEKLCINNI